MAGIDGGDRRCARQRQAHRIDDGGHRRGRAHRVAGAGRTGHAAFEIDPVGLGDVAGAQFVPVFLGVRARTRLLPAPLAVGHRSGRAEDDRQVHRERPHQKAGRGLVAAAEQHCAVDRMRAQQFLAFHRQEVAVEHGRRLDHDFADRQRRQLDRIAARLPDAALHRLGAVAQMRVARADLAPGVDDADDRPAHEFVAAHAHLLRALAMGKAPHVIGGEPALAAQFGNVTTLRHIDHPLMPPEVRPETTRSWKITIRMATGTMPTTRAADHSATKSQSQSRNFRL